MLIFIVLSTFICQTYNYYVNVYVHIMLSWNDKNKTEPGMFYWTLVLALPRGPLQASHGAAHGSMSRSCRLPVRTSGGQGRSATRPEVPGAYSVTVRQDPPGTGKTLTL